MKRWRKLHTRRSARFETLPVFARGLLLELVAHVDDEGWLRLGTNDRGALWRYVGAHRNERRALSRHLDTLITNGSVEESEEGWYLPSFVAYQEDEDAKPRRRRPASNEAPASVQRDSTVPPACVQGAPNATPTCLQRASNASKSAPNHPELLQADPENRIEKSREEESRPPPPPSSDTPGARAEAEEAARHSLGLAAKVAYVEAFRRRSQHQQPPETARPAFVAIGELARAVGGETAELLSRWADSWLDSGSTRLRTPGAWLAWCNAQQSGGWTSVNGQRGMAPPAPASAFEGGDTRSNPESFRRVAE